MIYCKIKDMTIVPDNRKEYANFLEMNEGKSVIIKRETGTRSIPQNSYYWSVVLGTIEKETGNNAEALHKLFKGLYIPPVFLKLGNKEYKMSGSTTKLNKIEMGEYVEKIRAHVADFGISIPDPVKDESKPIDYPTETLNPKF